MSSAAFGQTFEHTSEDRAVFFSDDLPAFNLFTINEDFPGPGSPINLHIYLLPTGGVFADMEAESRIGWPDGVTHELEGVQGTGYLGVETGMEVGVDMDYNVFGLFTGSLPLWGFDYELEGETDFDPLLLDGSPEPMAQVVMDDSTFIGLIPSLDFDIIPALLGISAGLDIYPRVTASMNGERIETESDGKTYVIDQEGQTSLIDVSVDDPGELSMMSTFYAITSADYTLVIEPYVNLTYLVFFETEILDIPFPIDLVSLEEERSFTPALYTHPLPSLSASVASHDFGSVELGDDETMEVFLENIGELDLMGNVEISGSAAFSVFPDRIQAGPSIMDGVVVTFEPLEEGVSTATLVVTTNDPVRPRLEIALLGSSGALVDPPDTTPGVEDNGSGQVEVRAAYTDCSCDAGLGGLGGVPMLAMVMSLVAVRRREA